MKTMYSKYPGICCQCGKAFNRGEMINYYGKGRGVEHANCGRPALKDNSSAEDSCCGDLAYEDQCAGQCGF